jgi:hypothetical protein
MLDDFHAPAELLLDPRLPAAGIALVHPEMLQPGEQPCGSFQE